MAKVKLKVTQIKIAIMINKWLMQAEVWYHQAHKVDQDNQANQSGKLGKLGKNY